MSDPAAKKQVYRHLLPVLAFVLLGFALASCGKRPALVDAPDDVQEDHFPQTYPDPKTDPLPEGVSK